MDSHIAWTTELCKYPFIMQTKIKPFREVCAASCLNINGVLYANVPSDSGRSWTCHQWNGESWLAPLLSTPWHSPALSGRSTFWSTVLPKSIRPVSSSGPSGLNWSSSPLVSQVMILLLSGLSTPHHEGWLLPGFQNSVGRKRVVTFKSCPRISE